MALRYELAGQFAEAAGILEGDDSLPALYHRAFIAEEMGETDKSEALYRRAAETSPVGCLHKRPESLAVLSAACDRSNDAVAPYLLGNILYSDRQFDLAIACYELSVSRGAAFADVYRTLAYGLFEKEDDRVRAGDMLRRALRDRPEDPRILFEYCQYLRAVNAPLSERLAVMDERAALIGKRDDATSLYAATLIEAGAFDRAEALLAGHSFHSYEGGEGVAIRAHIAACLGAAVERLNAGDPEGALGFCADARRIGPNYHEGHSATYSDADICWWEGVACEALGRSDESARAYERAAAGADAIRDPETLFFALQALKKRGETDRALALAGEASRRADTWEAEAGQYHHFEDGLSMALPFELDKKRRDMRRVARARALLALAAGDREKAAALIDGAVGESAGELGLLTVRRGLRWFS